FFSGQQDAAQSTPVSVLSAESDDPKQAAQLLEAERQRLIKKRKIDPSLCASNPVAALEWPAGWRRPCPAPDCDGELPEARSFNLMFESYAGAMQDEASKVYLRPETAQGIFVNFPNVLNSTRLKLPFGIAQIGKAFRNEINPRNYTFRSREFEQMEI